MKRAMMLLAGGCWIAVAFGMVVLLFAYIASGAGVHVFGWFSPSSMTVLAGLIHVIGFAAIAFFCFVIGAGLCAHGLVRKEEPRRCGITDDCELKPNRWH